MANVNMNAVLQSMQAIQVMQPAARQARVNRNPQHSFSVRAKPFQIQPFMIAPVLPGETLKELRWSVRAVTDPIKSPLVGWWLEHMFFYVKLRDLDARDDFVEMTTDVTKDLSGLETASPNAKTYHAGSGIDFVSMCLKRVTEEFFRQEGEAWNNHTVDGLPLAGVTGNNWLDSVVLDSDMAGFAPEDPVSPPGFGDLDDREKTYMWLVQQGLTSMTYEDFLGTYGVRVPDTQVESHRPELIRFAREWQYPSNTVNPSTGGVSSAVSWSTQGQMGDKKGKFFREPGFIFGVTVARPKVYFSNLGGTPTSRMNDVVKWLPAMLFDHPGASLLELPGEVLLPATEEPYWIDLKDLFIYGDQFVNFDIAAAGDGSSVALPSADLSNKLYASDNDIQGLFSGSAYNVRQDGIVWQQIAGALRDTSISTR